MVHMQVAHLDSEPQESGKPPQKGLAAVATMIYAEKDHADAQVLDLVSCCVGADKQLQVAMEARHGTVVRRL